MGRRGDGHAKRGLKKEKGGKDVTKPRHFYLGLAVERYLGVPRRQVGELLQSLGLTGVEVARYLREKRLQELHWRSESRC